MPETTLPPLTQVDSVAAWQPWQPDAQQPWDLKWAGHLYRRAAFGANLAELRGAVKQGLPTTLNQLLQGDPKGAERQHFLSAVGERIAGQGDQPQMRGWWVYAILNSPHPLREKMTLFWHNHFATSIAKVQRADLMFRQNQLLRQHALGKFRPFLLDMSRDLAMLLYLDSNSNIKGKPNENYARELMELFSLGVGNYKEADIKEAARAFTGWHTDGEKFDFNEYFHDGGPKNVLGQKGNWNGEDVVRIVLEQPAAARFLVHKLYRYLISETEEPPATLLEPLAESFRKSDYDIAALVRTMLASRHFFSGYSYRERVKSPVEFTVGAVRTILKGPVPPAAVASRLEAMGQQLFAPPNVKGWAGGRSWLTTATVLARDNYARMVASGTLPSEENTGTRRTTAPPAVKGQAEPKKEEPEPDANLDSAFVVRNEKLTEPEQIVTLLVDLLLQGGISRMARDKLTAFVAEGKPKDKALNRRVRDAVYAIMTMPEYQLA